MPYLSLTRRALLRRLGTAAAALPALELTRTSAAQAQSANPKRFVLMYAGMSVGRDGNTGPHFVAPPAAGRGYELTRAMAPLGAGALPGGGGNGYGVQDEVSIVSGLRIPWGAAGAQPPPGGKTPEFHYNTLGPQISGMRGPNRRTTRPQGPSADQIVAEAIGDGTVHRSLSFRVQPVKYVGTADGGGDAGRISWRDNGGGGLEAIDPIVSPRLAFQSLFGSFEPPDPTASAAQQLRLRRRRSVLSALIRRTEALLPRLGAADRQRLERHFDELAALERRLEAMPPPTTQACNLPPEPGADPPIGNSHNTQSNGNLSYTESAGYSDEEARASTLVDMTHMAFACDLTRSVGFRLTNDQSFLNLLPVNGHASDVHETTHGRAGPDAAADAMGWHIKQFAYLVARLRDTQEPDGSSLLDHTALVMLFEGGQGYDPEGDRNDRAHSTENMVALVAGRVGGLSPGQHVIATDQHPAHVVLSAMSAVGLPETLGEMQGRIPELFT